MGDRHSPTHSIARYLYVSIDAVVRRGYDAGMLDKILLGYLADGPRSGYDLKLLLENDGAHFWHAHHSQIYTTLRRLERRGWIRSRRQAARGLQERRVYTLLAAGRDALDAWRDEPLPLAAPAKDAALARLFFAGPHPARDLLPELRRLRAARRERLTALKRRPASETRNDPAQLRALTREHARAVEALTIRWLDQVIARLETERWTPSMASKPGRTHRP